jgi:hypothetical protein
MLVLPGQFGRTPPTGNLECELNRSPDSLRGTSWATIGQKLKPQNSPNQEELNATFVTTSPRAPSKTTKSKVFPWIWWGRITKKRAISSSCVTPTPKPSKKLLRNLTTKFTRKGFGNIQKGKIRESTRTLEESRQTFLYVP